jgi:valyl-tRNA synthetase
MRVIIGPKASDYMFDETATKQGKLALEIIDLVRKSKSDKNLSIKADIESLEFTASEMLAEDLLGDLARVTSSKRIKQTSVAEGEVQIEVVYP